MILDHYIGRKHYRTETLMLGDNWQEVKIYLVHDGYGYAEHISTYACNEFHLVPEHYADYISYTQSRCSRDVNYKVTAQFKTYVGQS